MNRTILPQNQAANTILEAMKKTNSRGIPGEQDGSRGKGAGG